MSAAQEQALPLSEFILTTDQSRYIVKERYLREFLIQKFGLDIDFRISTKNHRWKYWAPTKLTASEVNNWIRELEARLRQERIQRSATENLSASASSSKAGRAAPRSTWG